MNIYEKLFLMRLELQSIEIKKTGRNTFAKYDYMGLEDFLPHVNRILAEYKVASVVSFGLETASLTLVNAENPEETIVFSSPMSSADLKGCHAVQNLGAVQTYLRRYLYSVAFEIVEHDALDATNGKPEEGAGVKPQGITVMTKAQHEEIFAIGAEKGYAQAEIEKVAIKAYKHGTRDLTADEANGLIERLKGAKAKGAA